MGVITAYILFAMTTGIVAIYEIVSPVMGDLQILNPEHNMVEYKWISYSVFFLMFLVGAPLVFFSCIIPSWGTRFRESLLNALATP